MKETDADRDVRDKTYRVAGDELRQFVERIEREEADKAEVSEQIKAIYAEAKARGYDCKAIRALIKLRKKTADEIAEEEAVLGLYREALGI